MFAGAGERQEREHNEHMVLAWHIAALSRVERRKFPKLDKLLARTRRRRTSQPQTPEQMLAIMKMLNAAYGGTVVNTTEH